MRFGSFKRQTQITSTKKHNKILETHISAKWADIPVQSKTVFVKYNNDKVVQQGHALNTHE